MSKISTHKNKTINSSVAEFCEKTDFRYNQGSLFVSDYEYISRLAAFVSLNLFLVYGHICESTLLPPHIPRCPLFKLSGNLDGNTAQSE